MTKWCTILRLDGDVRGEGAHTNAETFQVFYRHFKDQGLEGGSMLSRMLCTLQISLLFQQSLRIHELAQAE